MAYSNTIPAASDRIKDSQSALLANFQAIQTFVEVNHETFGSANEGEHKYVTFPVQGSAPTFGSGKDGLYNLLNADTSKNELYIHKQTFAGTSDIPLTASVLSVATPASGASGWTNLPSGIKMVWGSFSGVSGAQTVTISQTGFAGFTQILSVQLTPFAASPATFTVQLISIVSATQFNLYIDGTGGFQYLVIGY